MAAAPHLGNDDDNLLCDNAAVLHAVSAGVKHNFVLPVAGRRVVWQMHWNTTVATKVVLVLL